MKYLSVCSGIEAASVAWHPLGWEPVAFSEIEKFPSAVLAHHYPNVPNLGDMTKFQEWPDEPVDLLVGGTPCQSFSVAGLRKGLEDPRGNLMLTYLAIAQRYRPRWLVWENVPGVLSSNGGRDFGTFLRALGELGYGWAYRVLDAQWFGVAQRRRRVFVVAHLGDAQRAAKVLFERESVQRNPAPSREARQGAAASVGGGTYLGNAEGGALDAPYLTCSNIDSHVNNQTPLVAQVFKVRGGVEREDGSRGSTNIGKQAGKGYLGSEERAFTLAAAQDQFVAQPIPFRKSRRAQSVDDHETWVEDGVSNTLNCFDVGDVRAVDVVAQPVAFRDTADCLTAAYGTKWNGNASADNGSLFAAQPVYGTDCYNGAITGDVAATLGTPGSSVNASGPTVMQPVAIQDVRDVEKAQNGRGWNDDGTAYTVDTHATQGVAVAQPIAIQGTLIGRGDNAGPQGSGVGECGSMFTLTKTDVHAVAQPVATDIKQVQWASGGGKLENDTAQALRSNAEHNYQFARIAMQVRRLTPVECERLQGFPDGYTNIPWRKKDEAPDGPRYKALGNSMAVPCMAWIGQRIAEVDRGD